MKKSALQTPDTGHKTGVLAGIAAYNEARYVGSVVLQARQYVDEVIVIDDGSTDNTARVAELAGATVIRHNENRGKGAAIQSILTEAKKRNPDILVLLDADAQHDPNEIPVLIKPISKGFDLVIGSREAQDAGAQVISIINRPNSILADLSHQVIYLNCGAEIAVAATKTFLSQLAIFYLLSFSMVNSFDEAAAKLTILNSEITRVLDWNKNELITLSQKLKDKNDFYYIARGINFAIASEGALKLKEVSYIHAEGMPAGELKHGTLALIEPGTPLVVICPADYTFSETLSNAMEAKSRGAYIIGVSDKESAIYDSWVKLPEVDELLYPMVAVVPLQLLAYYLAVNRGYDPDKPRNLAKSVTVK